MTRYIAAASVLMLGLATIGWSMSKSTVQPLLSEKLDEAGSEQVPVLVVCEGDCQPIADALAAKGINIKPSGSMELGILAAEITVDQLETVASEPGVSAVEYDEEAGTLAE